MRRITRRAGILVGMLTIFGSVPTAHAAILIDTPRAEWGCELSPEQVVQGITSALISRGWIVTDSNSDGNIVAQIIVRNKHTLVVDIAYDKKSYDIAYKSSINLNYKDNGDGTAVIHRNANKWISNIHQDIVKQLSALCTLS